MWAMLGGRKNANGILLAVLLTAMAFPLHATFTEYASFMIGALGLTTGAIAYEDAKKASKKILDISTEGGDAVTEVTVQSQPQEVKDGS